MAQVRSVIVAVNGGDGFELACVLKAGEGAVAFENVAQRVDALGGVLAFAPFVETTDFVLGEAAKGSACTVSKAADAKASRGTKSMQSSSGLWAT